MERTFPAIYTQGVLKPQEPLDLPEHQRVLITIHGPAPETPEETLNTWQHVYEGFSEDELTQVEATILARSRSRR